MERRIRGFSSTNLNRGVKPVHSMPAVRHRVHCGLVLSHLTFLLLQDPHPLLSAPIA